jgi:hypothetical protein
MRVHTALPRLPCFISSSTRDWSWARMEWDIRCDLCCEWTSEQHAIWCRRLCGRKYCDDCAKLCVVVSGSIGKRRVRVKGCQCEHDRVEENRDGDYLDDDDSE